MSTKVCIISGSTLGGAEYVAEHLDDLLQQNGISTCLYHGAELAQIIENHLWLIVTSTHGAGDLPDNLSPLFQQLAQQTPDLTTYQYAVVGLGNSDYDTFCGAVDLVEQQLQDLNATQLCNSLKIDVLQHNDPELIAEDWLHTFLQTLK